MLRKIRSYSFLSPKKEAIPALPTTSPIPFYQPRPVSPIQGTRETVKSAISRICAICLEAIVDLHDAYDNTCHHVMHERCASEVHTCPICVRSVSASKKRAAKVQRLKKKASVWLGASSGKFNLGQYPISEQRDESRSWSCSRAPEILTLDARLRCQYGVLGVEARDALLMLEVQALLRSDRSMSHENEPPANIMIIIDFRPIRFARRRHLRLKNTAAEIVSLLRDHDRVGMMTTVKGEPCQKVVFNCSEVVAEGRDNLRNFIYNWKLDASQDDSDTAETLKYAAELLKTLHEDQKAHIIFLSDDVDISIREMAAISREFLANELALHVLGVGSIVNDTALRALAHCSRDGVFLSGPNSSQIRELMLCILRRTELEPLINISISLQLYEGATLREVKYRDCEIQIKAPQELTFSLPRIGPYETRQFFIVIHLPPVAVDTRLHYGTSNIPNTNATHKDESGSLTNSFRLAELEHIVQSMPGKLASCTATYNHPLLLETETVRRSPTSVNLKRTQLDAPVLDLGVMILDIRRCVLHDLTQLHRFRSYDSPERLITALRKSGHSIRKFCSQFDVSLSTFRSMLSEISLLRSRVSAKYHLPKRHDSADNRASPSIATFPDAEATRRSCSRFIHSYNSATAFRLINEIKSPPKSIQHFDNVANTSWELSNMGDDSCSRKFPISVLQHTAEETPPKQNQHDHLANIAPTVHLRTCNRSLETPSIECTGVDEQPLVKCLYNGQILRIKVQHPQDFRKFNTLDHSTKEAFDLLVDRQDTVQGREVPSGIHAAASDPDQHDSSLTHAPDIARCIWRSHKKERGEFSMLSDGEADESNMLLETLVFVNSTSAGPMYGSTAADYFDSLNQPRAESTPVRPERSSLRVKSRCDEESRSQQSGRGSEASCEGPAEGLPLNLYLSEPADPARENTRLLDFMTVADFDNKSKYGASHDDSGRRNESVDCDAIGSTSDK